jgi:multidrug resistance efflux pump
VSGIIEADEIRLGSRVGGRVAQVLTEEGRLVKRGEKLVQLEPYDLTEKSAQAEQLFLQAKSAYEKMTSGFRPEEKDQARARVEQLKAKLAELEQGPRPQEIKAAEADVAFAQAQLDLAKDEFDRTSNLAKDGAATQQRMDEVASELRAAQSRLRAQSEKLALLNEGTRAEVKAQARAQVAEAEYALALMVNGYRAEEIAEAYAAMQAADAARRAIQIQINELEILAPLDGVVEAIELQPGDLIGPNVPAITVLDLKHLWIRAYVPEDRLNLKVGQELPLTVDSYPGEEFAGTVSFIARAAEFTPSNVQTPEERSKQVFRVKVDLTSGLDKLRPGMAVDVRLDQPAP